MEIVEKIAAAGVLSRQLSHDEVMKTAARLHDTFQSLTHRILTVV